MDKILTTNEIILKLSTEIIDNPDELSRYLVFLTANMWQYGKKTVEAEIAYAKKWDEVRMASETDGRANIKIKFHPEYLSWKMAQVSEKTLLEIIRSLKKRLDSLGNELKSY
jgi:hypothetical protein